MKTIDIIVAEFPNLPQRRFPVFDHPAPDRKFQDYSPPKLPERKFPDLKPNKQGLSGNLYISISYN